MELQLTIIDPNTVAKKSDGDRTRKRTYNPWNLDEATRIVGLRGVARARLELQRAKAHRNATNVDAA